MKRFNLMIGLLVLIAGCNESSQTESSSDGQAISPTTVAGQDYLTPRVREQVEALKNTVGQRPETMEEFDRRLDVLWAWLNAMARRDGGLKFAPNLTAMIGQAKGVISGYNLIRNPDGSADPKLANDAFNNREVTEYWLAALDGYIEELSLRESDPAAFGHLDTDTKGPFESGSFQTIRQIWTVGTRDLAPNGYLMIAQHFMADQGSYQVTDPAADHYVSIESSNPRVVFEPGVMVKQGMHGGFRAPVPNLVFQVKEGVLTQGDTVTITYGDQRSGSRGFQVQSVSNDHYQLPVYISFDGSPINALLNLTPFSVVGKGASGVQGFVPSVVAVNEPFSLSVRSEDDLFNRATGNIPAYGITLNGQPFANILAGQQAITLIENISLEQPGVYRFGIKSADGSINGSSNPIWVQENPLRRIYWGDTHGHSGFAEGQGSPEGYFRFGRDDSRLDFLTLSEHDIWLDDGEWQQMIDAVRSFNKEGEFIAYLGYEYTVSHARGGHHNVLYLTPDGRERVNIHSFPVLSKLYEGLRERYSPDEVLIIPHAHQAGYWKLNDAEMETLVEIQSQHGYFEWFGQKYLAQGYRTGFVSASDDHLGHPGYTSVRPTGFVYQGGLAAVRAPEKTSVSIFEAMKQRQTYATTVDRMILDVRVNGVDMGGFAAVGESTRIEGRVMGTAAIDTITIIKNAEPVWHKDYRKADKIGPGDVILELAFHSPSDSNGEEVDNPRGARLWHGTARVEGGILREVDPGYQNALHPLTRKLSDESAEFALRTRGETRRLRLKLSGVDSSTRVHVHLDENRESPTAPARTRRPALLQAEDFSFTLGEVILDKADRSFKVDQYLDRVMVRILKNEQVMDRDFSYLDQSAGQPGDYYFVRVEQANSGMAWSSPVWLK